MAKKVAVTRKVITVGDSEAVTLPKHVRQELEIGHGDTVQIFLGELENGGKVATIEKASEGTRKVNKLTEDEEGNDDGGE